MEQEEKLCRMAFSTWRNSPNLVLLGNKTSQRLPIFSFLIRHPFSGLYLHYNYVSALLNDLFGIQSRGGCACAGPYAQDLLGMDEALAKEFEALLLEDSRLDRVHLRRYNEYSEHEAIRPGFVRLNLPYFISDEHIQFILKAVAMVADHGWKLLPQYMFNPETGEWKHRRHKVFRDRKWLGSISYLDGHMTYPAPTKTEGLPKDPQDCLLTAKQIFENAEKSATTLSDHTLLLSKEGEKLRWFLLPSEAATILQHKPPSHLPKTPPFTPRSWEPVTNDHNVEMEKCKNARMEKRNTAQQVTSETLEKNNYSNQCSDDMKSNIVSSHLSENTGNNSMLCLQNKQNTDTGLSKENSKEFNQQSSDIDNASARMNCGDLGQSCPLNKPMTCNKKTKQSKHDSKLEKTLKESTKPKFVHPSKSIFKPMVEAIEEFSMIKDGDHVMVCLSGGKDSLSLLHALQQYKYQAKSKGIAFEIGAATVDPQSTAYDPRPLIPYLAALGVPYFFEEQGIIQQAAQLPACESICSFCSRMKRGRLYACARREGYNVLAMGQHLDDLTESFLMSAFHNGLLRTMKANYTVQEGDLRVIRPLVFVREKELRQFADKAKLPVIAENCPACFEAPKERHRTKQLLAAQELLFPEIYSSLLTAMRPLMAKNRVGMESTKMKTADYDEFV
ncbi:uncharacterized protein LOC110243543 [Exaiptasia diaphana]|nr:uncharacterized protein LOC110243543 [Exaiptasia diaphana]